MKSLRTKSMALLLLAVMPCAGISGPQRLPLFETGGPRPEAVRQGSIGSCYLHASLAALAHTRPELLRKLIRAVDEETYRVEFPDGKKENAYLGDVNFARQSGYDRSGALWVAVLLRAYAQAVLRNSLVNATGVGRLSSLLPGNYGDSLLSNDFLLLAYDRAIRAVVDQEGNISPQRFERELSAQMEKVRLSPEARGTALALIRGSGVFEATSKMIDENGELFGAYRAVGQGGLPQRALQTITGQRTVSLSIKNSAAERIEEILGRSGSSPVVASTRYSFDYWRERGDFSAEESWYVPQHAYTVLAFDRDSRIVTVRNPWGDHPDPDGVSRIPLSKFTRFFEVVVAIADD